MTTQRFRKCAVPTSAAACLLLVAAVFVSAQEPVARTRYLSYARASADWTFQHYDEIVTKWRETFDPDYVFGYKAPGGLLEMAVIYSYLYEKEKNRDYAERAKKVLTTYGDFRSIYPESSIKKRADYQNGVPALPDFFFARLYIRTYDVLRRARLLSPDEDRAASDMIAESMRYLLSTQEWGAMNRSSLRAETLAWAARALPGHPDAGTWAMQRDALGNDNWGQWEIEDATIYHGIWLYSMLGYADALGRMSEFLKTPEAYYYAQYFLKLMCPAGMLPDFGDAHWMTHWTYFLVFFEAAAGQYRDPHMKWAAATIAGKFVDFSRPTNVGLGYMLLDCYRWGADGLASRPPASLTEEVMEDVQGKKIVFRDGWAPGSTYLLLNYRDEGDGGLRDRDYLRDSIPVEEEKMTHGHADENSIALLMTGGSVLLHDGGYRDYMPSGPYGAFRQDYFHNRLCVRPEKIFMGQKQGEFRYSIRDAVQGQDVLEFFRNAGSYRRVRTQKIDFLTFPDFDYSRTRVVDDGWGYESDRVIVYVKDPGFFVVFDLFKSKKEEFFTLANMWHTRKILAQGPHWYDTVYDTISGQGGRGESLPDDRSLLIFFPSTHFRLEGVEPEKRHYQDEWMIHQTTAQHFELGETVGFVTVLIPHKKGESIESWLKSVSLLPVGPERAGMGIQIRNGDKTVFIGVKNDLRMDMIRDWRRPRYTYEAGKIAFGDFETNGDFLFGALNGSTLDYTVVNLTKASFRGKVLAEAGQASFGLAFDASPDTAGFGKLRYWRDRVTLK